MIKVTVPCLDGKGKHDYHDYINPTFIAHIKPGPNNSPCAIRMNNGDVIYVAHTAEEVIAMISAPESGQDVRHMQLLKTKRMYDELTTQLKETLADADPYAPAMHLATIIQDLLISNAID